MKDSIPWEEIENTPPSDLHLCAAQHYLLCRLMSEPGLVGESLKAAVRFAARDSSLSDEDKTAVYELVENVNAGRLP